jgi:hypothetical protein
MCIMNSNFIFIVTSIFFFYFSHALKLLRMIPIITFYFSASGSLLVLYFALVRCKLQHAHSTWNSLMNSDSNKLQSTQRNFAALYHDSFFQDKVYRCDKLIERLNFLKLQNRRRQFDALFLINAFSGI